ncbi:hypothetical protein ACHHYP_11010 [Achlya hypogyna]|uniref:Uncharacterized protein n=1 Tax=Achlya hypogyna TaxID=1202772 RepID=A0A1V9ZHW3_ACHHY|nr:hypothetical protein ACHHYP_11010 [Achlya hypogyna]
MLKFAICSRISLHKFEPCTKRQQTSALELFNKILRGASKLWPDIQEIAANVAERNGTSHPPLSVYCLMEKFIKYMFDYIAEKAHNAQNFLSILKTKDLAQEVDGMQAYSQLDARLRGIENHLDPTNDKFQNDRATAKIWKRPSVAQFMNVELKKLEEQYAKLSGGIKLGVDYAWNSN